MPRRQFVADLQKAQSSACPPGVHSIKSGDDDGQFEFEFTTAASEGTLPIAVNITAMVTDVSEYPSSHEYMLFCGEDAPHYIAKALQEIRTTGRKTVFDLIQLVSASLSTLAPDSDGDHPMSYSVSDEEEQYDEDEDADDIYDDEDESFSFGGPVPTAATAHLPSVPEAAGATKTDKAFRDRVRSDLRAAKEAGFKVGHLGNLLDGYNSYVTVSIRMSKLGISDEAMQAWKLEPKEYLIMLIQYPNGYKTNEQFQAYDSIRLQPNIGMRVFAGKRYKPTIQEAISAFTKARKDRNSTGGNAPLPNYDVVEESSIHDTFISRPLQKLLEENLVPILRFRSTGMDWSGAEAWYAELQQSAITARSPDAVPDMYYEPEDVNKALPNIMHGDQYRQRDIIQYSFPTLAMQFTLRHFVRCTEFCLVCHRKLDSELEAIKPYVCDRPLCLFQYMSLGFGPSIEHEIISQPYVVDLLVSFCYNSAKMGKLKDFPDGLDLKCPALAWQEAPKRYTGYDTPIHDQQHKKDATQHPSYEIGFDRTRCEIIFFNRPSGGCPVARGQWIVVHSSSNAEELHCRVSETSFYPTISVDEPVALLGIPASVAAKPGTPTPTAAAANIGTASKWENASISTYCKDFDELTQNEKCQAICTLLDTLPTVNEMRNYLAQHRPNDLRSWVERLSRDATNLLRWIIASNRACIMQVETEAGNKTKSVASHKEERLHGADGYMQFRFAMGAPDKESRFVSEVRKTTDRLSLQYPTIFAWHGSPLHNWHMIIREGLHFKETAHGRAYGHGVYHAKDSVTSVGYANMGGGYGNTAVWSKSMLRISGALALNDIVNAPKEFVSQSPYYVVSQLDWIQTRYLLVQCAPVDEKIKPGADVMPKHVHPQDPDQMPRGPNGGRISIPASAIKSGRPGKEAVFDGKDDKRRSAWLFTSTSKKLKDSKGSSVDTAIELDDDDTASIDTDFEDVEILFPEPEPELDVALHAAKNFKGKSKADAETATDYVPGSLGFETLPVMPMPTYATSATTKRLLSELKSLANIQAKSSPVSLGWSIDTEKIENVYQWIVELHSFHTFSIKNKPLPLVEDMKKAGVTSIVLEIRFGPDFPYSPPYIRVIRPRFLPFTQGGGGHIVIGGAMCMELLTNSGWSSVMSMENVLLQVRMAIASEPFARLEGKGNVINDRRSDYGAGEAAEGYLRACQSHGWQVPPGFREVAQGMSSAQASSGAYA